MRRACMYMFLGLTKQSNMLLVLCEYHQLLMLVIVSFFVCFDTLIVTGVYNSNL